MHELCQTHSTEICTYKTACEVDTDCAPVLAEADVGEGVEAYPARIVVVTRNGHVCQGSLGCSSGGVRLKVYKRA